LLLLLSWFIRTLILFVGSDVVTVTDGENKCNDDDDDPVGTNTGTDSDTDDENST
jgi:hypothetical protein